ncbi:hypothetical protein F5B21DRAFT_524962 [Xylaria acuta]|nr:hypothetical protein F5B21DRAFT_524962 [Xylaria acuta]
MVIELYGKKFTEPFTITDGPAAGLQNYQVTHSPPNKRARVLPKRLLSSRTLRFCPQEVLFECCEMAACESYLRGLPIPEFSGDASLPRIFQPSETNSYVKSLIERWKPANLISEATHYIWPDIVAQYSNYHLTFASDEPVAISGIARYFRTLSHDNIYIAGLWSNSVAVEVA